MQDDSLQLEFYRQMLTIRRFEERCNALYMQGKIPSTLHLYNGQEAVAVGVCAHLSVEDTITSTHRPHGHAIAKGVSLAFDHGRAVCQGHRLLRRQGRLDARRRRVGGDAAGHCHRRGGIPVAAGVALACKQLGTGGWPSLLRRGRHERGRVPRGAEHGGHLGLPVVFVCENNLYAASTPVSWTFKVENVADRAAAYGMPGVIVDGNDVLAVYEAAGRAVERARAGDGPTLIECKTYRQVGHSRSDPRTYRSKKRKRSGRRAIRSQCGCSADG